MKENNQVPLDIQTPTWYLGNETSLLCAGGKHSVVKV